MGISVCLIDDGRPLYLEKAIHSLSVAFPRMPSDNIILVNDSGDAGYAQELLRTYPHIDRQIHHAHRRGLAGAIHSAWTAALEYDCEFIFHCEGDFTFSEPIQIGHMSDLLDADKSLAQVSLKRQPGNEHEAEMGGFIECSPSDYFQQSGYVLHRTCFTFNPCLIPRHIAEIYLAHDGAGLEKDFTELLVSKSFHFGIYGQIADPPRAIHVGAVRAQGWKV